MKKRILLLTFLQLLLIPVYSQISGNQIYGKNNQNNNRNNYYQIKAAHNTIKPILVKDSVFLLTAKVLINREADRYIVVFGVHQEDSSAQLCNKNINKRIEKFKKGLSQFGVNKDDIYVDLITQNFVYDYTLKLNNTSASANQFVKGMEIKKNIIFRLDDIDKIDAITTLAANSDIYDIVKVDYLIDDMEKLYEQLFEEAQAIITKKKELFFASSDFSLKNKVGYLISEQFDILLPQEQYKAYQAYESSNVEVNYSRNSKYYELVKKEMRKRNTFYYQRLHPSGFDKEINANVVKVGIQAILELKVQIDLRE